MGAGQTMLVEGRSGAAYNVGSDEALSIEGLARAARAALNPEGEVLILGQADPVAPRSRYIPSIDRARTELGLDIWTPLDIAIRRTADHARAVVGAAQRKRSA